MTTIVYKDGYMACDGRVSIGAFIESDNRNKIFHIPSIGYFGFCGNLSDIVLTQRFLTENVKTNVELLERDYLVGNLHFLFYPSKNLVGYKNTVYEGFIRHGQMALEAPTERFKAIGSGLYYATTAIRTKPDISALEAVKIACKSDMCSGGKIRSVYVGWKKDE